MSAKTIKATEVEMSEEDKMLCSGMICAIRGLVEADSTLKAFVLLNKAREIYLREDGLMPASYFEPTRRAQAVASAALAAGTPKDEIIMILSEQLMAMDPKKYDATFIGRILDLED